MTTNHISASISADDVTLVVRSPWRVTSVDGLRSKSL